MDNTPTAPAEAPKAPESEATPTTNQEPQKTEAQQTPDMHGFTSEQLADIDKFFKANGGFDAIKSKISNPSPAVQPQPTQPDQQTAESQPAQPQQPAYVAPEGSITQQEFLAKQYFMSLAGEDKYSAISGDIASGNIFKEMSAFNIKPLNQDGSINDAMVRRYLDLKVQTVPAKATSSQPDASAAPTVTYTPVGDKIESLDQAYKVLMEAGNPNMAKAEEYIKNHFSSSKK